MLLNMGGKHTSLCLAMQMDELVIIYSVLPNGLIAGDKVESE